MINQDDLDPLRPQIKPRDLQPLSIEELETYITALENEIKRADAMIAQKNAHKQGIEALFGRPKE